MSNLFVKGWGVAYWYDDEFDLDVGPPNPSLFCIDLKIDAEEIGIEGEINYQINVCTPLWIASNFSEAARLSARYKKRMDEYIWGRGFLLLQRYDIDLIERFIHAEINNLEHYAFDES